MINTKSMRNLLLYFSAFIPMYFLVLIKFLIELINSNLTLNTLNTCIIILFSVLILLGILGLVWNIKWNNDKTVKIKIKTAKNITDQHFFSYFSLFVLFALSFELTKVSMFLVSIFIIVFIGVVYVQNSMFYINPFLNILGYSFYEISYWEEGCQEEKTARMFFRGELKEKDAVCSVKFKNEKFAFIAKEH